jgi:hypothetical protein
MPTPNDFESSLKTTAPSPHGESQSKQHLAAVPPFWHKVNLLAHGNVLDTFRRALMAAQLRLIAKEEAAADVVIHPRFTDSTWHDFENFGHYLQAGRDAATPRCLPSVPCFRQITTSTRRQSAMKLASHPIGTPRRLKSGSTGSSRNCATTCIAASSPSARITTACVR